MEVKVGQIYRDDFNEFCVITWVGEKTFNYRKKDTSEFNALINEDALKRVKDTPQELIKVGDLYEFITTSGEIRLEKRTEDEIDEITFNVFKEYITKILTPNSDGGYNLQYDKEAE